MNEETARSARCGGAWTIALAIAATAGPAYAVDVLNRDKVLRELIINDSDGQPKLARVPAKEKLANVCESCVILIGDTSVEAEGNVTVVVERGKVSIGSKR